MQQTVAAPKIFSYVTAITNPSTHPLGNKERPRRNPAAKKHQSQTVSEGRNAYGSKKKRIFLTMLH